MTPEEYTTLYEKYLAGECTLEEETLLMEYRDQFQLREEEAVDDAIGQRIFARIQKSTARFSWWWAAAALLPLMGSFWLLHQPAPKPVAVKLHEKIMPVKPGANVATLTLANGRVITLDDAPEGKLAETGNSSISKNQQGLSYTANGQQRTPTINTIAVPRGGQYQLTLSDGTRVWLNSESSLTFPDIFNGSDRKLMLSGEAYFEVSKDDTKPFTVQTAQATVHVLGTSFNMSAYKDEKLIKATLVDGAIRLSNETASTLLSPGEQGIITATGIEKKRVNINQEIAWKSGYFVFRNNTIQEIMRQISRWYNVQIAYSGDIPQGTFGGTYSRSKDLEELLNGLELTGLVHFKIEGRTLIVMN